MGPTWTKNDFLNHKKSLSLIHLEVVLREVIDKGGDMLAYRRLEAQEN